MFVCLFVCFFAQVKFPVIIFEFDQKNDGVMPMSSHITVFVQVFLQIGRVFSVQISVHRNCPAYLPNYFGHLKLFLNNFSHLKSIFACNYHYF